MIRKVALWALAGLILADLVPTLILDTVYKVNRLHSLVTAYLPESRPPQWGEGWTDTPPKPDDWTFTKP